MRVKCVCVCGGACVCAWNRLKLSPMIAFWGAVPGHKDPPSSIRTDFRCPIRHLQIPTQLVCYTTSVAVWSGPASVKPHGSSNTWKPYTAPGSVKSQESKNSRPSIQLSHIMFRCNPLKGIRVVIFMPRLENPNLGISISTP